MRRRHLFEFNERPDCPAAIRESIVETLGNGLRWGRIYRGVGEHFAAFCAEARCDAVLDLCSGTGEPVAVLLDALERAGVQPPRFTLSDLMPNPGAMGRVARRFDGLVEVCRDPVDATAVPPEADRPARTIISSFHHFPPEVATRIIADAVARRRALFIVEPFTRALSGLLPMLPALTVAVLANPLVCHHGRLAKALLTYAIPVIPAAGLWDAIVSVMRTHTRPELEAMAAAAGGGYRWTYRRAPFRLGGRAMVFYGIPSPDGAPSGP